MIQVNADTSGVRTLAGTAAQITASQAKGAVALSLPQTITLPSNAVINGGSAANDDLTLQGTTNATRTTSYVAIQPNGGFTGIGTATPDVALSVQGTNPPQMAFGNAVFLGNTIGATNTESDWADNAWYSGGWIYRASDYAAKAQIYQGAFTFSSAASGTAGNAVTWLDRMIIAQTGAVRMHFYGSGAATFDANGNITSVSDERFKIIQGNFDAGLKEILQINPILYKYNELSKLDMVNTYAGFSAQNVMQYIPEAVGKDNNGYYTFNDRPIIAALVNAVKTLKAEVDELRSQLSLPLKDYAANALLNEERTIVSELNEKPL